MMRRVFKYRDSGNCFAVCITNGCVIQEDPLLIDSSTPELIIFSANILLGHKDGEIEPAYNYLKRYYDVKIIDKHPKNGLLGRNLDITDVDQKLYTLKDIQDLNDLGFCVVASVLNKANKHEHGVLVCKGNVYDPTNESEWIKPKGINSMKSILPYNYDTRWLIAFKIIRNERSL